MSYESIATISLLNENNLIDIAPGLIFITEIFPN